MQNRAEACICCWFNCSGFLSSFLMWIENPAREIGLPAGDPQIKRSNAVTQTSEQTSGDMQGAGREPWATSIMAGFFLKMDPLNGLLFGTWLKEHPVSTFFFFVLSVCIWIHKTLKMKTMPFMPESKSPGHGCLEGLAVYWPQGPWDAWHQLAPRSAHQPPPRGWLLVGTWLPSVASVGIVARAPRWVGPQPLPRAPGVGGTLVGTS